MRSDFGFEQKLLVYTCLVLCIIFPVATVLNLLLDLDIGITLITGIGSLIFLLFYLLGRKNKYLKVIKSVVTVFMILAINFGWIFNNGSHGSILSIFVILIAFLVFTWRSRFIFLIPILVLTNLAILFILEYFEIFSPPAYESEKFRIIDVYVGIVVSILIIFLYSRYARQSYMNQYLRAKRSDHLKSAFLANLSHEIRTPLNAIMGFSGLLGSTDDKEKKQRYNSIVQQNGTQLTRLIGDLLDISMIEANQITLRNETIIIDDLLLNHSIELKNKLKEYKKQHLTIESKVSLEKKIIETDLVRLRQILGNLSHNAIKYTEKGGVTIQVQDYSDGFLFSVIDTGIGIRQENLKYIFNRFFKIDNETSTLYRGTGLGLYLCRELVTMLGGNIWVESVYGKGSSFKFYLPEKLKSKSGKEKLF